MIVSLITLGALLLLATAAVAVGLTATLYGRVRQYRQANRDLAGRIHELSRRLVMQDRRLLTLRQEIQNEMMERLWSNQRRTLSAILDTITQGRRSGLPADQLLEMLAASLSEQEGICSRHELLLSLHHDPHLAPLSPPSDRTA